MKRKILMLFNNFEALSTNRGELVEILCKKGDYDVYLSLPKSEKNKKFSDMGCKIVESPIDRRGLNPLKDMKLVKHYKKIFAEINPEIIFSYTIKPNVYGAMANRSGKYRQICNITGMGGSFYGNQLLAKTVISLYKVSVKRAYKVLFQNNDDKQYFIDHKMIGKDNYELIPGSGVNLTKFYFDKLPETDTVNFSFIGRLVKIKGVDQYLELAKRIRTKHPNTQFIMAGFTEEGAIEDQVHDYQKQGIVNYIGFKEDVRDVIRQTHCTVLTSLGGEGTPNAVLESSAMGRANIVSDTNGSRDAVDAGVTGFLYEKGNVDDLERKAEEYLALSDEDRIKMGIAGRKKMEEQYDRNIVIDRYLAFLGDKRDEEKVPVVK